MKTFYKIAVILLVTAFVTPFFSSCSDEPDGNNKDIVLYNITSSDFGLNQTINSQNITINVPAEGGDIFIEATDKTSACARIGQFYSKYETIGINNEISSEIIDYYEGNQLDHLMSIYGVAANIVYDNFSPCKIRVHVKENKRSQKFVIILGIENIPGYKEPIFLKIVQDSPK